MYKLHRGSVLPRVDVKHTAEGMVVHAARPTRGDVGELVLYGIAFLMFLGAALVPAGIAAQLFRALNAGGVFLGFLGMLAHYLRRRRLYRATLLVRPWPIRLGGDVTLKYRAMLKKSVTVSSLTAKLQCAEEVIIGGGKSVQKKSGALYELELQCSKHERRVVEEEWTIPIPPTLPPSFDVPCNAVRWRLTTVLTTSGVEVPADFALLVIPEIAE
jgi:hypothetical protein